MNSNQKIVRAGMVAAVLLMPVRLLRAQQQGANSGLIGPISPIQTRQMPVPAARVNDDNDHNLDPSSSTLEMHPDTHTLASIETLTFGTLGAVTSFVDPSFRFVQSGESSTGMSSDGMSSMGIHLDFNDNWRRSRLTGFYSGARVLHYPGSSALPNGTYNNLGVAEELNLDRWVFRIREDLLASPDANLGGIDVAGLILSGGNGMLGGFEPGTGATDTIITQPAKRLRTTTSGEIDYYLSRRSILTATSSYATLTFASAGFIDSHGITGRTGYDYLLSGKDTIGLIYDYSRTRFGDNFPFLQTNSVQLAFGRRLTGRLAYKVMGGPQKVTVGTGVSLLTWTLSNNLSYQTRRTGYSLNYSHGASGTSGVLAGASSQSLTGSINHSLTKWWSVATAAGYAFSTSLTPTIGPASQFGAWHGTASFDRSLGRHFHLTLNYGFQQQSAGSGACPVTGCSPSSLHQTAGAALDWHPFFVGGR